MELPARGPEPWPGARRAAGHATDLLRAPHAARARGRGARSRPRRPPHRPTGERVVGGAISAWSAPLHHRHPARVSPVDRLRAVVRLAVLEDAAVAARA